MHRRTELRELLILCSHNSDFLHGDVKIVLIAVLPNIMYHTVSTRMYESFFQSRGEFPSKGSIVLFT